MKVMFFLSKPLTQTIPSGLPRDGTKTVPSKALDKVDPGSGWVGGFEGTRAWPVQWAGGHINRTEMKDTHRSQA